MKKIIEVQLMGNFGNQLIELMIAETIRHKVAPSATIVVSNPPPGIEHDYLPSLPDDQDLPCVALGPYQRFWERDEYHRFATSNACILQLDSYYQRVDYYRGLREVFRTKLLSNSSSSLMAGINWSRALLIHIRGGDIMQGAGCGWYFPLPLEYYAEIIASSQLQPVFFGQLGTYYSELLKLRFPEALFIECPSALTSFNILRSAPNLALSVSTFSWVASFLSNQIQLLYVPLAGLFKEKYHKEQPHFIHRNAPKTIFYDFQDFYPNTQEYRDMLALFNATDTFRQLSEPEIDALIERLDAPD